jgi:hypothetical protein
MTLVSNFMTLMALDVLISTRTLASYFITLYRSRNGSLERFLDMGLGTFAWGIFEEGGEEEGKGRMSGRL